MLGDRPPACVAVAFSAGRDSTALLHATLIEMAARHPATRVVALHVHHGLGRNADAWEAHGRRSSQAMSATIAPVEFIASRLTVDRLADESIEAWARRRRYQALATMARAARAAWVLLAHHRLDQAETLVLQALRGGGLAGLASMPAEAVREGIVWRRPWLDATRDQIDDYLVRHRLAPAFDDSNADRRFDRNRLRLDVWPAFVRAFPQAERSLARSAAWAGEGRDLLDEIAEADLARSAADGPLSIELWLTESPARRSNGLRAWLRRERGVAAPASLVARLLRELPQRRTGCWPSVGGEWRLHRGWLRWAAAAGSASNVERRESTVEIDAPGRYPLPGWGGTLLVESASANEAGVALARPETLELRERRGGERFRIAAGRPARPLKQQFQAAVVPAWERAVPLVYRGGQLLFVPGLGFDADRHRSAGEAPLRWMRLGWIPGPPVGES